MPQPAWPDEEPVICKVRMINEYPLIPDLEQIEARVHQAPNYLIVRYIL